VGEDGCFVGACCFHLVIYSRLRQPLISCKFYCSKPYLENVLFDVWFESFKVWRLPHALHAIRFVHVTVYRIMPTGADRALSLLVARFRCFCRRLAFRTEHSHFFYYGAAALFGVSPLIIEYSWSHSDPPHSVGLLWTSGQPDAETSTWQHTTLTRNIHPCPRGGLEPTIPAGERP